MGVVRIWLHNRGRPTRTGGSIGRLRVIGGRVAAALLLLLLAGPVQAQRVDIYASADSVTVGERFFVSITAVHDGAAEVLFPDPAQGDTLLGDLVIVSRTEAVSRPAMGNDPGARVDSVAYEVATFALDTAYVPPQPIQLRVAEQTFTVETPPLAVPVRSLVPPGTQDIRGLTPLVEFPRPWWFWLLLVLAFLLISALIAYLIYRWLRKREERTPVHLPPVHTLSPIEEAEERLRRLEATDLRHPEEIKPFYVELSDLARTYLFKRLGLAALEETTRELTADLSRLADRGDVPDHTPAQARRILELADLVKFADLRPDPEQGRNALQETRSLLQQVEDSQRSPELEVAQEGERA